MKNTVLILVLFFSSISFAKIAFQKQIENKRLIVVADDQGQNQKIISNSKIDTYHPDISGDGVYVAYSRGEIKPGKKINVELVIKNLESGVVEVWTPKGDQYIHAEFSGNGRFLAFSGLNKVNGRQNIQVIDLETERTKGPSRKEGLTFYYTPEVTTIESEFDCYAPAVSSDGEFVVYHRTLVRDDKRAPKQLMLSYVKSGETFEVTEKENHAMFPSLSADDRYVAYTSKDDGQWDIYTIDLWTQEKNKITDDENIEFTPVFSTEGAVYYTRFTMGSFEAEESQIDIYKISKEQVFDPSIKLSPLPFLNDKASAEYVVSFSNELLKISQKENLLSPERSSFGAVFHEGKVYIAGGHQGPEHTYPKESFLNKLEVYDTKTKVWSSLSPMNISKHGFQMTAYKNYLYVFGGFTFSADHKPGWKSLNTIERYDIEKGEWTVLESKLPRNRSSNAIGVVGSKVYLLGGWDSTPKSIDDYEGKFLKAIDIFDLETEKAFESKLEMPLPLRRALGAVTVGSEIYLMGGIGQGSSHFAWIDNVTVLETKTETWRESAPLPFATFAPGVGEVDGDLYLIGGMVLKNKETFNIDYVDDVYKFDQKTSKWQHAGTYLNENKGFPQVVRLSSKELGVLGGHTYELMPDGKYVDHPVKSFDVLKIK